MWNERFENLVNQFLISEFINYASAKISTVSLGKFEVGFQAIEELEDMSSLGIIATNFYEDIRMFFFVITTFSHLFTPH